MACSPLIGSAAAAVACRLLQALTSHCQAPSLLAAHIDLRSGAPPASMVWLARCTRLYLQGSVNMMVGQQPDFCICLAFWRIQWLHVGRTVFTHVTRRVQRQRQRIGLGQQRRRRRRRSVAWRPSAAGRTVGSVCCVGRAAAGSAGGPQQPKVCSPASCVRVWPSSKVELDRVRRCVIQQWRWQERPHLNLPIKLPTDDHHRATGRRCCHGRRQLPAGPAWRPRWPMPCCSTRSRR